MTLTKAMVTIQKGSGSPQNVYVLFNPTEYTLDRGNEYSWVKIPGLSQPIAQFITGEVPSLSMDLFFDSYEAGEDVRTYTSPLTSALDVDSDLHAPPICQFVWGSLIFKGLLEKCTQKFTMFSQEGLPVRATLSVTFKSYKTITEQFQEIPRQSADRTKQKLIKQGDQLWMVAAREYEDPGHWRAIARANGIDNPLKLQAGQRIVVPRLE